MSRLRVFLTSIGVSALLLGVAYMGMAYMLYEQLSSVKPGGGFNAPNTPAHFRAEPISPFSQTDFSTYALLDYQTVRFPSRTPNLNLAAWYVEADPQAPAIVLVHGLNGCKCEAGVLLAGAMLHRAGYNVLIVDLRDMGQSDVEDGRQSGGTKEYLDVLGAFDWLVAEKHIPPTRIGLFGESFGAATALIAFGQEPRLAAIWADSPFSDLRVMIDEELVNNHYPTWIAPGGLLWARWMTGDDYLAIGPRVGIEQQAGRPIFLTHGELDARINVHHSRDLAAHASRLGGAVQTWYVPSAGHTQAMFLHTAEYEQRLIEFFKAVFGK